MGQWKPLDITGRGGADIGKYHDGPDVPLLATRSQPVSQTLILCRSPSMTPSGCGIMVAEWLSRFMAYDRHLHRPGNNEGAHVADRYETQLGHLASRLRQEQPGDYRCISITHNVTMLFHNANSRGQ